MKQKSLLILAFAIVSPIEKLSYIFLGLFFAINFFLWIKRKDLFKFNNIKQGFLNPIAVLFFAMLIILKLRNPMAAWDRDLSLLIFPLFFSVANLNKQDILYFLKCFVYLLFIVLSVVCIYEFIQQNYFNDFVNLWKLEEHYNNSKIFYFFHAVSERIDFHHIYLALYVFMGFIIGVFLLETDKNLNKYERIIIYIAIMSFLIFSILSLARMSIICFSVFGFYYSFKKFILENTSKIRKRIFFIVMLLLSIFASTSQFSRNQINKMSKDPRAFLFQASLKLSSDNFIIGYGTKEASVLLQKQQEKLKHVTILNNSHNQYLDFLLGGGVLMLILFIIINIMLLYNFKINYNHLAIMIQIFFLIQLLTESLLYRYRGIVLYALFMSLFYDYNRNNTAKTI